MFSVKEDVVLDPFAGTGTTLAVALATARNAIGVDLDGSFVPVIEKVLSAVPEFANRYNRARLAAHVAWAARRIAEKGPLKHTNCHYGFPVMTSQERELLIDKVIAVRKTGTATFRATYGEKLLPANAEASDAR
jgi:hypothetical protein